jgi:hypothetical protein
LFRLVAYSSQVERYRADAHRRFKRAITMNSYDDARDELNEFEIWLRLLNASAADSLLEATSEKSVARSGAMSLEHGLEEPSGRSD